MKLVSFSGAQSTGKTTLLNHLSSRNYDQSHIKFIPEVTRIIHREYDLPINEGAGGFTQLLINAHHVENVYKREPNNVEVKILDRCILDGFVYTCFLNNTHKRKHDILLDCVSDVSDELFLNLICKYDIIFHTSPEGVELKDDGQRSVNEQFRNTIIEMFDRSIKIARDLGANIITLHGSVKERLEQMDEAFKKHGINNVKI